jgi:SAM-dependent methyltransferase
MGWDARGVDVNPEVNAWLRARGEQVEDGTIADAPAAAPPDVIAFWNCFDQLADPAAALRHARERLVPNGYVVVRVPNGACYARLRTRTGRLAEAVLATNNLLGFPYRFGFTPGSLMRLLERAGFAVTAMVRDTLVPTSDQFTRPWARLEERGLKTVVRMAARGRMTEAPWLEVYARLSD